jgi:hypothetical protein
MNALVSTILVFLILVVLLAPRRFALLGMMAGVLYLTQGATTNLFGVNFYAVRFLEVAGFARVMVRREFSFGDLNRIDHAFSILYSYTTIVYLMRSNEPVAFQLALFIDAFLCYFIFRGLIVEIDDIRWFLRALVILLVPYVGLVAMEMVTHQNQFGLVGQTAEMMFRNERPRCIGSFRHSITMGTLGVSFLPLYIGLAFTKAGRVCALVGIGLCVSIVLLSNSGGPVSASTFGLVGWLCWFMRKKMFLVRRVSLGLVILLGLLMKAPIWYLPARISDFTGGSGWHRSYLLDVAINNINKWWLAGMPIIETKDWIPYSLAATGGADITNQYLSFGLSAGLGAVALFIGLLILSFQGVGKALTVVRSSFPETTEDEYMLWGLGATLLAHVTNWFGVCYFDQIYVVWFMQLAFISRLSQIYTVPMEETV